MAVYKSQCNLKNPYSVSYRIKFIMKQILVYLSLIVLIIASAKSQTPNNALLPIGGDLGLPMAQCPLIDDPNHPVMLPHPDDCRKYYVCFRRLAYARQCPLNFYWSQVTYRCDSKMLSNCQIDLPIYTNNQDYGVPYSPYPYDRCPENNQWNARLQRCEPPQVANYLPWTPPRPIGNPTGTAPTPPTLPALHPDNYLPIDPVAVCKGNAINTYQPYPGDCHKFIHCGPQPTVIKCAGELFWNVQTQSCDVTQVGCQLGQ